MNATHSQRSGRYVEPALLIARLMLAFIFLHEGLLLAGNLGPALAAMAKLGVSAPLALATITFQICAGTALALGWHSRMAATALALFCVATAVLFHTHFDIRNEMLHFQKDLAIAGGMIALAVSGAGSWSVDALARASRGLALTARPL